MVCVDKNTYKGYKLSQFQIDAIKGIEKGENVIVSTHTGNGKTLIADYAIDKCFRENKKVVYTAPIKALSNQKYSEFVKEYGEENVGLVTGDRVINKDANILVVTTEVLRNMIHENYEETKMIRYIILDEIHYISDEERGTVWEEIVIFKHKDARIIGLSATIPNIEELCDWISSIHQEEVLKIHYPERIVKQKHYYYDKKIEKASYKDIIQNYLSHTSLFGHPPNPGTHLDFIKYAAKSEILPVLCFVFSRKQCEEKALELSINSDLLNDKERQEVTRLILDYEKEYEDLKKSHSWKQLKLVIIRGIGFHHAGLLPIIKQFMEGLFEKKLCKVLYATETFAVGINHPVKTAFFDGFRKYDGKTFRNIYGSEYFQMAGRAGRRNIDEFGLVFTLADYKAVEYGNLLNIEKLKVEPVKSQFSLSYNTVLNLIKRNDEETIKEFFKKSLANYQFDKRLLNEKKELELLKRKSMQSSTSAYIDHCFIKDLDCCPIYYDKNKEMLEMYQAMLKKKDIPQKDITLIQKKMYKLKQKTFKVRASCTKDIRKNCLKIHQRIDKKKRKISQMEASLKRREKKRPESFLLKECQKKTSLLKSLNYITKDNKLLPRGQVGCQIHIQELLVTELVFRGFFHENQEDVINGVLAGIVCEDHRVGEYGTSYPFSYDTNNILAIMEEITKKEIESGLEVSSNFVPGVCGIMEAWSRGGDLFEITKTCSTSEGDFVNICRRTSDLLRQIKNLFSGDFILQNKISNCLLRVDRGMVTLGL